ncbi:hypothetical protein PUNSTDRAFT_140942, partial [Punctularia strigosozonata HHB-11173 SS5]|uniref:uncharacterized protein n=1 Tax=Punctularia strigosozonata (strain HHB-11173) TaxID=741275 RepID=UPI0004417AE7
MPAEIIRRILDDLAAMDIQGLFRCFQTAKVFYNVYRDSLALRYKVALALAGKAEGQQASDVPVAQRLQRLMEYERRWAQLDWTSTKRLTNRELLDFDLRSGFFASTMPDCGVLAIFQLPSATRGIVLRGSEMSFDSDCIQHVAADASQDLICVFEQPEYAHGITDHLIVYAFSISTGKRHPLGKYTTMLRHPFPNFSARDPSVYGDYAAVLLHPRRGARVPSKSRVRDRNLIVWNWKTGQTLMDIVGEIQSYTFLTNDLILLVIIEPHEPTPFFELRDLSDGTGTPCHYSHQPWRLRLDFPPTHQPGTITNLRLAANAGPKYPRVSVPFYTPHGKGIVAATFDASCNVQGDKRAHQTSWALVMYLEDLINFATQARDVPFGRITWSEWGPEFTRLTETPAQGGDARWLTFGYRMALANSDPSGITVYDFNPFLAALRNEMKDVLKHDAEVNIVTEVETVEMPRVWTEPVTTSLPYSKRMHPVDGEISRCSIGEDNIILSVTWEDNQKDPMDKYEELWIFISAETEDVLIAEHERGRCLCHLPAEIIDHILGDLATLDIKCFFRCLRVAKIFLDVYQNSAPLQYGVALILAGKSDGFESCDMPVPSRMQRLMEHERRWAQLDWSALELLSKMDAEKFDMRNGVFAHNHLSPHMVPIFRLPSATRGIAMVNWCLWLDEFRVRDIATDATQDLICIFEHTRQPHSPNLVKVHTLTLSHSRPHPLGLATATFQHASKGFQISQPCIYGDYLAALMFWDESFEPFAPSTPGDRLTVWNWKTGHLHLDFIGNIDSYIFLGDNLIMLSTLNRLSK